MGGGGDTTLLFEDKNMLNFRFKIRVWTFGQSFRPPSLLLGQCPKFHRFSILQPSLNVINVNSCTVKTSH